MSLPFYISVFSHMPDITYKNILKARDSFLCWKCVISGLFFFAFKKMILYFLCIYTYVCVGMDGPVLSRGDQRTVCGNWLSLSPCGSFWGSNLGHWTW